MPEAEPEQASNTDPKETPSESPSEVLVVDIDDGPARARGNKPVSMGSKSVAWSTL